MHAIHEALDGSQPVFPAAPDQFSICTLAEHLMPSQSIYSGAHQFVHLAQVVLRVLLPAGEGSRSSEA